jgi:plastocyanin
MEPNQQPPTPSPISPEQPPIMTPPPKNNKRLIILAIVAGVILIVISLLSFRNLSSNSKTGKTSTTDQTETTTEHDDGHEQTVTQSDSTQNQTEKIEEMEATVEEDKPPVTHTVSYTNSCYSPQTLSINKGDTVKFVNNSNLDMQPASDPHPNHTNYPEFDADNGVDPGGSFSFTFTRSGTWGFHEHYKPSCKGTITVN